MNNGYAELYGNGKNVRDWIFVDDNCEAIEKILLHGKNGEVYNIGGDNELSNYDVVTAILDYLDLPLNRIKYIDDRPGHDFRYALNTHKLNVLNWKPRTSFPDGLSKTIQYYIVDKK